MSEPMTTGPRPGIGRTCVSKPRSCSMETSITALRPMLAESFAVLGIESQETSSFMMACSWARRQERTTATALAGVFEDVCVSGARAGFAVPGGIDVRAMAG